MKHRVPFGVRRGQIEYMQITKMTSAIEMCSAGASVEC